MKRFMTTLLVTLLFSVVAAPMVSAATISRPTGLWGNVGTDYIEIGWNAVDGAGGYDIYRDGAYTATEKSTTSFRDSTTGSHAYAVVAFDSNGQNHSAKSDEIRLETKPEPEAGEPEDTPSGPLAAPTGLITADQGGKTKLQWNSVDGAGGYDIYRGTGNNLDYRTTVTSTQWVDTDSPNGFNYAVVAFDTNKSNHSSKSSSAEGLSAQQSQQEDAGVDEPPVEVETPAEEPKEEAIQGEPIEQETIQDEEIDENKNEEAEDSDAANPVTSLDPPSVIGFEFNSGRVDLVWLGVDGAAGYNVYHSVDGKDRVIETVFTTSLIADFSDDGNYYVTAFDETKQVFSSKSARVSNPSGTLNAATGNDSADDTPRPSPLQPVENARFELNDVGEWELRWDPVDRAEKYFIYKDQKSDSIATVESGTSYRTDFVVGSTYAVRASGDQYVSYSESLVFAGAPTEPAAVTFLDVPLDLRFADEPRADGRYELSWSPVWGASRYEVWSNLGRLSLTPSVDGASYTLEDGQRFWVFAISEDGLVKSAQSEVSYFPGIVNPLDPVENARFRMNAEGQWELTWDPVDRAERYFLYEDEQAAPTGQVDDGTTYRTDFVVGRTYSIRASGEQILSAPTNVVFGRARLGGDDGGTDQPDGGNDTSLAELEVELFIRDEDKKLPDLVVDDGDGDGGGDGGSDSYNEVKTVLEKTDGTGISWSGTTDSEQSNSDLTTVDYDEHQSVQLRSVDLSDSGDLQTSLTGDVEAVDAAGMEEVAALLRSDSSVNPVDPAVSTAFKVAVDDGSVDVWDSATGDDQGVDSDDIDDAYADEQGGEIGVVPDGALGDPNAAPIASDGLTQDTLDAAFSADNDFQSNQDTTEEKSIGALFNATHSTTESATEFVSVDADGQLTVVQEFSDEGTIGIAVGKTKDVGKKDPSQADKDQAGVEVEANAGVDIGLTKNRSIEVTGSADAVQMSLNDGDIDDLSDVSKLTNGTTTTERGEQDPGWFDNIGLSGKVGATVGAEISTPKGLPVGASVGIDGGLELKVSVDDTSIRSVEKTEDTIVVSEGTAEKTTISFKVDGSAGADGKVTVGPVDASIDVTADASFTVKQSTEESSTINAPYVNDVDGIERANAQLDDDLGQGITLNSDGRYSKTDRVVVEHVELGEQPNVGVAASVKVSGEEQLPGDFTQSKAENSGEPVVLNHEKSDFSTTDEWFGQPNGRPSNQWYDLFDPDKKLTNEETQSFHQRVSESADDGKPGFTIEQTRKYQGIVAPPIETVTATTEDGIEFQMSREQFDASLEKALMDDPDNVFLNDLKKQALTLPEGVLHDAEIEDPSILGHDNENTLQALRDLDAAKDRLAVTGSATDRAAEKDGHIVDPTRIRAAEKAAAERAAAEKTEQEESDREAEEKEQQEQAERDRQEEIARQNAVADERLIEIAKKAQEQEDSDRDAQERQEQEQAERDRQEEITRQNEVADRGLIELAEKTAADKVEKAEKAEAAEKAKKEQEQRDRDSDSDQKDREERAEKTDLSSASNRAAQKDGL